MISFSNRRDACKPRAEGFAANEGRGWWCKPVMVSRILLTYSVTTSEDIHYAFGNLGSVHAPRAEGVSEEQISSLSPAS